MGKSQSFLTTAVHGRQYFLPARIVFYSVVWVLFLFVGIAYAQQPTDAQRSAIKSACRSDFIAQCSGVTPGGIEALTCLQQHNATLSPSCQSAVSAVSTTKQKSTAAAPAETPTTAPAQTDTSSAGGKQMRQPTPAQRDAVKSACRSDFMAQCSGVTPGGSAALACLRQHNATLSPSCQQAVSALGGGASAPAGGATTSTGGGAPAAMPAFTPRQELMIARRYCGPDFRALCRGVALGGGRGIGCLRDNFQRLSPTCQKVLARGM